MRKLAQREAQEECHVTKCNGFTTDAGVNANPSVVKMQQSDEGRVCAGQGGCSSMGKPQSKACTQLEYYFEPNISSTILY